MRRAWYNCRAADHRSGPNSAPITPYAIFSWLFGSARAPHKIPIYGARSRLFELRLGAGRDLHMIFSRICLIWIGSAKSLN